MTRRSSRHASTTYEEADGAVPNASRLVVILSCVAAIGAMIYGLQSPAQPSLNAPETPPQATHAAPAPTQPNGPPPTDTPPADASPSAASVTDAASLSAETLTPTPSRPRVGIVAGHWGYDTGAVCPDGLQEVDINFDVAQRVYYILQAKEYHVDLLEEFDSRLNDYRADALISIHADSCADHPDATPPASGFKVASVVDSIVPEAEERLVACLSERYAARTGMYLHANSITPHMSYYHTFYEINGYTPGAIIETGFMMKDRDILTQRADLVAQGIVEGIVCFIENEVP